MNILYGIQYTDALYYYSLCECHNKMVRSRLHSSSKRVSKSESETSDEKKAKAERENQQLVVYLFICLMLILSWLLGTFKISFFWVFGLIGLTFAVWWNKAMSLLEKHLRQQELILHRRRALRQSETTEWFNFLINRWLVSAMKYFETC